MLLSLSVSAFAAYEYTGQWGTIGTGDGQFIDVMDVDVADNGYVYTVDPADVNCRVQYFDSTGGYLGQFGDYGDGDGLFMQPFWLAIAPNGDVYVADIAKNNIQYFG
jgi:DNA-binding beta-propeller fold protein YncE